MPEFRWWIAAALAWSPPSAWAQAGDGLELDQVMVLPIQAQEPALREQAVGLDALLHEVIGAGYLLTELSEVPDFAEQGYDARTYMDACPPGRYPGCGLVVAQRVEGVDWAIGGTLVPAEGLQGEASLLTVHLIDVPGSREVMAFGVVVGGASEDRAVLTGVGEVFDKVVGGLAAEVDLRGDLDDPAAQAALEARRQELIAASLESLEAQLGEVIREELALGRLDPPKLTKKDLQEYAERDDRPPWERLGMSQAQFIRFENSGATLVDWRYRMRGRLAQVLLRAGVGGGPGTWGVHHEGRWLVEFNDQTNAFENVAIRQYQEGRRVGSIGAEFELGFGLLPWLEVSGLFALRNGTFTYRFKQDAAADPVPIPGDLLRTTSGTTAYGARVLAAPLPTYPVRPTLHLGLLQWIGGTIPPNQDPLVPLRGTRASYLQVGPGVEASAGRNLNLFLRGQGNVLLAGQFFDQRQEGQVERLQDFEAPVGDYRGGFDVVGGIQVRIGLLPPPSGRVEAAGEMDLDEPDL